MAGKSLSEPDSQDPPKELVKRTVQLSTNALNTVRVPGDRQHDRSEAWFRDFSKQPAKPQQLIPPRFRTGNEVKYLIDGPDALKSMAEAMRTVTRPGHFIYLLGWWADINLDIDNDAPPGMSKLKGFLAAADARGAIVRAMIWDPIPSVHQLVINRGAVDFINKLKNGAAILDGRGNPAIFPGVPIVGIVPFHAGSQHQKILCVFGEVDGADELVVFCGGIDFNPDRMKATGNKGEPLHDVHCRIRGPAAADLLQIFIQRWMDHPDSGPLNKKKGPLITLKALPKHAGDKMVHIGRTFGRNEGYNFAPKGETTARDIILHAIASAKRFIYVEDQYFVGSPELTQALREALKKGLKHLTAVITHFSISDMPEVRDHRTLFIRRLVQDGGDRVRIFHRHPPGERLTYVHAKTWIMDDELAFIGSPNVSRRCMSHDSEVTAAIYDTSKDFVLTYRLAHWLRIELWRAHLNLPAAELADGVASAVHWLHLPKDAQVRPYVDPQEPGPFEHNLLWDAFVDPE